MVQHFQNSNLWMERRQLIRLYLLCGYNFNCYIITSNLQTYQRKSLTPATYNLTLNTSTVYTRYSHCIPHTTLMHDSLSQVIPCVRPAWQWKMHPCPARGPACMIYQTFSLLSLQHDENEREWASAWVSGLINQRVSEWVSERVSGVTFIVGLGWFLIRVAHTAVRSRHSLTHKVTLKIKTRQGSQV
jgi:hypothetical protein